MLILDGANANTYGGTTYLHQGTLELNKIGGYGIIGNLVITGGTLVQDRPNQLGPNVGVSFSSGAANFNTSTVINNFTNTGAAVDNTSSFVAGTSLFAGGTTVTETGASYTSTGDV